MNMLQEILARNNKRSKDPKTCLNVNTLKIVAQALPSLCNPSGVDKDGVIQQEDLAHPGYSHQESDIWLQVFQDKSYRSKHLV